MKNDKNNFNVVDGVFYDRNGNRLHGAALYNAEVKYLNGGLKQTLDQNKQLKQALYYSVSLIHEQDKEIQHLKNILGSVLPTLNLNIPSLDFNER